MTRMSRCFLMKSVIGCVALLATTLAHAQTKPLTVCMAEDNPPLSYQKSQMSGLDVRISKAIANEVQRPLKIIPFESELEAESTLAQEASALLSSGVCDLVSGYPLLENDLGEPARNLARVPDYPGAKRRNQRPWVKLKALVPTIAYHTAAWGIIVREESRVGMTLAAPGDARFGVVAGTMAGSLLMLYRNGKLRTQLVSLAQNEQPFKQLEDGKIDATLSSFDHFDAWRLNHPSTTLRRAAYVHPLRINIGFVLLPNVPDLLKAANTVIKRALADGKLQQWASQTGVSWTAPVNPQVRPPIGLGDLISD